MSVSEEYLTGISASAWSVSSAAWMEKLSNTQSMSLVVSYSAERRLE